MLADAGEHFAQIGFGLEAVQFGGAFLRGTRHSSPSSSMDSCAGVSVTAPALVTGQVNRPFSSRLANRQKPWPEALAIPIKDFYEIAPASAKREKMARKRVLLQHFLR